MRKLKQRHDLAEKYQASVLTAEDGNPKARFCESCEKKGEIPAATARVAAAEKALESARKIGGDVTQMSTSTIKKRVVAVYGDVSPAMLGKLSKILESHKGKEPELYRAIAEKYKIPRDYFKEADATIITQKEERVLQAKDALERVSLRREAWFGDPAEGKRRRWCRECAAAHPGAVDQARRREVRARPGRRSALSVP